MKIEIRKTKKEDARKIAMLWRKTFAVVNSKEYDKKQVVVLVEDNNVKSMLDKIKQRDMFCLVVGNKILGTVTLSGDEVGGMMVRYNYIRRGVGKKMIRFIENYAKKKKIKKLKLFSTSYAVPFYERMGYGSAKKVKTRLKDVNLITYEMTKVVKNA